MRPARHRYAQALAGGAQNISGEPQTSTEKILGVFMLLFAIGFNLWLYRMEPTAKVDPNDNTFQFALVYRTNQIWDYAQKSCASSKFKVQSSKFQNFAFCLNNYFLLADHWVPNWNEGYNLPFYYSHIPQIVIVASWRLLSLFTIHYSLFTYYHLVIYLLLCLFPLTVFLSLRLISSSWLTAGFGALLASQISTDGFYGLDPASFLWRGYGLSSQLFAMIFLPLAIAFIYRKKIIPAILFLLLTAAGHLGIGIMAFLSLIPLLVRQPKKIFAIAIPAVILLSYWIIPAFLADNFHNFSFWDPVWKFNSYGVKEVVTRLGNGALFDFGRLPIITALVFVGLFAIRYSEFTILFFFFLLLYFGRTTWGNIINFIPAMREFHLSRFIVGVHAAGLFLAPIGLAWIIERVKKIIGSIGLLDYWIIGLLVVLVVLPVYGQTIRYAAYNDTLIATANANYAKQSAGADSLVSTLQELQKTAPGRIFAGRGGSWGKDFRIAETPMFMYLSNFAIPTVLWMPETWSPNADTEQYFREDKAEDYALYNIRYVATPITLPKEQIQPFWKKMASGKSWILYSVDLSSGYFTAGVRPAVVAADKYSRTNVIRLWIQSEDPKNGLYPELTFDTKKYPVNVGLPNFKMLDEVTFQVPDGSTHNLFAEPPKYISPVTPIPLITLSSQTNDMDMVFSTHVKVEDGCTECMVILKQTYHPNWRVTIDGEPVEPIITFPFFIGIPVDTGTHTIIASYEPSRLKVFLLVITGITLVGIIILFLKQRIQRNKNKV
jgi:hypothetical protein